MKVSFLCTLISGDDLLSRTVARAVPSALAGLTPLFGMGRGVAPPLLPPESYFQLRFDGVASGVQTSH